jgi:hypothetical protein
MRFLYLVGFLFVPLALASQDINEQLGVRSRAMGGAGRAISTTNEAIYLNPAALSQFRRFNLDADYVHRIDDPEHYVGLSLVDSTTDPFAGAVDFHLGIDPTKGSKSLAYLGSFALSMPVSSDYVYIGASVKYAFLPVSLADPVQVNQFDVDIGILVKVGYGLSLAAAAYNLVPTNSKRLPLSVAFGLGFSTNDTLDSATDFNAALSGLNIAVDWIMRDLTNATGFQNQLMTGIEYSLFSVVPLRAGYSYALETSEHLVTGGTGFASGDLGVDGFYEQNLTNLSDRSFGAAVRLLF